MSTTKEEMTINKDTEAPERIWRTTNGYIYKGPTPEPCVEYIRADLVRVDPPAAPTAQCYWCKHPDHDNKVCPVPYLAQGAHGLAGSYPCGCSLSTVISDAPDEHPGIAVLRAVRQTLAEYEDDEALQIEARAIDRFLDLESKQER